MVELTRPPFFTSLKHQPGNGGDHLVSGITWAGWMLHIFFPDHALGHVLYTHTNWSLAMTSVLVVLLAAIM